MEMMTDCDWVSVEDKMPEVGKGLSIISNPTLTSLFTKLVFLRDIIPTPKALSGMICTFLYLMMGLAGLLAMLLIGNRWRKLMYKGIAWSCLLFGSLVFWLSYQIVPLSRQKLKSFPYYCSELWAR